MAQVQFTGLAGQSAAPGLIQPDNYQKITSTPADFGAGIGQAEQGLGGALGDVSSAAIVQQNFANRAAVTDRLTRAQEAAMAVQYGTPGDPNSIGYYGLQGDKATSAYKGSVDQVRAAYSSLRDGLDNDEQRRLFDQESRRTLISTLSTMAKHNSDQTRVYAQQAATAAVGNSQKAAELAYTNDDLFNANLQEALHHQQDLDAQAGAPPEVMQANQARVASQTYAQRVLRTSVDNPLAAQTLLQQNIDAGQVDAATATTLLGHLKPLVYKQTGEALADQAAGRYGGVAAQGPGGIADAIHGQESGGRATSATSVDNAQGGWQIIPATFARYAKPGEQISNPADNERVGRRIIDDLSSKFGGDPARIAVGYFSGEGNVAPAGSPTPYKEDRRDGNGTSTSAYVRGVLGRMGPQKAAQPQQSAGPPSMDDVMGRVDQLVQGQPPEVQDIARAKAAGWVNQQNARYHGVRTALVKQSGDVNAALADGRDVQPLDESAIRRVMPSDQADEMLTKQREAQVQGQIMQQVAYGSPADINAIGRDIDSGVGPVSGTLRARMGQKLGLGTDGQPLQPNDDPADYRLRRRYGDTLAAVTQRRNTQVLADPAGYAMANPALADAVAPLSDPQATPERRAAAVQAVMAEQQRLGVPEDKRSALPASVVQNVVHQLTTVDSSKRPFGNQSGTFAGRGWMVGPDVIPGGCSKPRWRPHVDADHPYAA